MSAIDMLKAIRQDTAPVQCGCRLGCTIWGAYWRNLVNTIERSVCSGDAALCQIPLTTVWRVRGKTIRSVLCNIVYNNCAQCDAHTYEQTNSSLDWVLSHWARFTVLRFIFVLCITACCMQCMLRFVTR